MAQVKRIIAVGSGKGGVGKSTVSANLAVALAGLGWRVGLVDADIFGPSVPLLFGAEDYRPKGGFVPLDAHGVKVMSIGFMVDPAKAVVWRGPMVSGALMQLVRDTTWGELDALLIDMPPGTGDIQLSLAQRVALTGAVVVTTPQDLALIDVRKATNMFAAVKVPILGMVENMATFICPHCGGETDIFGHGGGEREAAAEGVPFLGRIPLTRAIRDASDTGRPVALDTASAEGRAYAAIAADLAGVLEGAAERPFPDIVFES
nr:Mrp/NBP35 family ATP-binding protein [Acuticoccus yangtzensis]